MIILNEFNRQYYINTRLAEMLPSDCTLDSSDGNTTIHYNGIYICRVFEIGNHMNVYHHVLKSDVLYGDTTPDKFKNLSRFINNCLLYNSLVIDKILLETIYCINLSIEQIHLMKHMDELYKNDIFDNIENEIRTEKLKFISELN